MRQEATEEQKDSMIRTIEKAHLSFLFCCSDMDDPQRRRPSNRSGWFRYRFFDGMTGEQVEDILPILN